MCKIEQKYEMISWNRCTIPNQPAIAAASAEIKKNPRDGYAYMKKGHALAALSMMREAEECYAMAITCDPFNWEFYRHRAHRFLSCWRFQDAAADFLIASRLNPDDWNVWYHLGLSWFLLRDYEKAAAAYSRCYALNKTDMDLIPVTDWYWMTLKRLHRDEEAQVLIDRISPDIHPGELTAYFARLLMYKGLKKPEDLLSADPEKTTDLEMVTMGFGIGNYYLISGEPEKGYAVMENVIRAGNKSGCPFAFSYLACMVELEAR